MQEPKITPTGYQSTLAIGGGDAINLNMDLPVTSASPDAAASQWAGFNATRRLTTNQLP